MLLNKLGVTSTRVHSMVTQKLVLVPSALAALL